MTRSRTELTHRKAIRRTVRRLAQAAALHFVQGMATAAGGAVVTGAVWWVGRS